MDEVWSVIEPLKSGVMHKLGNGADLNFQSRPQIKVPAINTNRYESAFDQFVRPNPGRS